MTPDHITPLIITFDEEENIARCLVELSWAKEILVLDSGSTDATLTIAKSFPNVAISVRPFDSHAAQWNHGLNLVETEWVLSLDADYITTPDLQKELTMLVPDAQTNAFYARFVYCVHGRRLRTSLYPERAVLFRRSKSKYVQDGHTQRLKFDGKEAWLRTSILHDDRKPLSRWLRSQDEYSIIEARHLLSLPNGELRLQDRVRQKIFFAPWIMPLYLLIGRGLIFDGWRGWFYTAQRTIAEFLLSMRLLIEKHRLEQ